MSEKGGSMSGYLGSMGEKYGGRGLRRVAEKGRERVSVAGRVCRKRMKSSVKT